MSICYFHKATSSRCNELNRPICALARAYVTVSEFMVAFSDNRYNIWPWQTEFGGLVPPGEEWRYYPVFMAPGDPESAVPGVSCANYGSRVQSVMAARVSTSGLLLTAPTNRKPFEGALPACGGLAADDCIEFPLSVRNNTGTKREVTITSTISLSIRRWNISATRSRVGPPPESMKLTGTTLPSKKRSPMFAVSSMEKMP